MPKSKRQRVVHLSKTDKKGKELTRRLYANVQECVDKYDYLWVFGVENMRNTYLKDVRTEFSDSRMFFGKTKVMAVALGTTPETSYAPNLHLLVPHLIGSVGLLFTSRSPEDIQSYFSSYAPLDYARAGTVAPRSFSIPPGIVYSRAGEIPESEDAPLSHTLEPELRKLEVPTRLAKGKVMLETEEPYPVCREGEVLDGRKTTLLKMFGVAVAEFRVGLKCWWDKGSGEVHEVEGMEVD